MVIRKGDLMFLAVRCCILVAIAALSIAPAAADPPFSENVQVINDDIGDHQTWPSLAVGKSGILYASWEDYRDYKPRIYFSTSVDRGWSWGDGLRNDNDTCASDRMPFTWAIYPAMFVDRDENIYLTWTDQRNGYMNFDVYYSFSTDGGKTFSRDIMVQGDTCCEERSSHVAMAPNGDLYIAWATNPIFAIEVSDIYISRSTDGGYTWSTLSRLNDVSPAGEAGAPRLAIDGNGVIYAVWTDQRYANFDVWFAKSADGGLSFSPNLRVNQDTGIADQGLGSLSLQLGAPGTIHVAWADERNVSKDAFYSKSTDGGLTFGPEVRIDDAGPGFVKDAWPTDLAINEDTGTIYVIYDDTRDGNFDIRFTKSLDGGLSFEPSVKINDSPSMLNHPLGSLAIDESGILYVVFHDERLRSVYGDIFSSYSEDDGQTWVSPQIEVCDDLGKNEQYSAAIAADGSGTISVAWTDGWLGSTRIFFATSTNGGVSFNDNVPVDVDSPATSQEQVCAAAFSTGEVFVAWQDDREGVPSVFASRTLDQGLTFDPPLRVNDNSDDSFQMSPDMACVDGGSIGVVWVDRRGGNPAIYSCFSTDRGQSYGSNLRVSNAGVYVTDNPAITSDSAGNFYVAWEDQERGGTSIALATLPFGDSQFTAKIYVDDGTLGAARDPDVAIGPNREIYVAWQNNKSDDGDIYFAYSTNGQDFSAPARVNQLRIGNQANPHLWVTASGLVYILWDDPQAYGGDIEASIFDGVSIGPPMRVNDDISLTSQYDPHVTGDAFDNVNIVWTDYRNPSTPLTNSNADVYFAQMEAAGRPEVTQLAVQGYLAAPELLHITDHEPELAWNFQDAAPRTQTAYELEVWTAPGGKGQAMWDPAVGAGPARSLIYNSDGLAQDLLDGEDYYFRVRATNDLGIQSQWNEVRFHMNSLPPLPKLPVPADGEQIGSSPTQVLAWTPGGLDGEGDVIQYFWEFSADPLFPPAGTVSGGPSRSTQTDPVPTAPGMAYHWRVKADDGWEATGWADDPPGYWSFTTEVASSWVLRESLTEPLISLKPLVGPALQDGIDRYLARTVPFTDPEQVLVPGDPRTIIFYALEDPFVDVVALTKNLAALSVDMDAP